MARNWGLPPCPSWASTSRRRCLQMLPDSRLHQTKCNPTLAQADKMDIITWNQTNRMICILPHLIFPTSAVKLKILRGSPCVCRLGNALFCPHKNLAATEALYGFWRRRWDRGGICLTWLSPLFPFPQSLLPTRLIRRETHIPQYRPFWFEHRLMTNLNQKYKMIDNGNFLRNFAPEIPRHFQKQLNNSVKYYAAIRYIK